jgi:hypothetical protein
MMSDTYSTPAEPEAPVDPTPEDTEGVLSPQDANLRDGNLIYHCGLCRNYQGAANMTCTRVSGEINPYQLSDEYDGYPNPLKHKTPAQFQPRPGGPNGTAAPAAPEVSPEPASLRIGRKVY